MKKIFLLIKIFFIYVVLNASVQALQSDYLSKGIELFKKKNMKNQKFYLKKI